MPRMNAALRAVVRRAISAGLRVYGIRRGYEGLLNGETVPMDLGSVADIIHREAPFSILQGLSGSDSEYQDRAAADQTKWLVRTGDHRRGRHPEGHGWLCKRGVRAVGVPPPSTTIFPVRIFNRI